MTKSLSTVSEKSGLPPGALIHVGDVLETVTRISVIDYSTEHFEEQTIQSIDEILKYKDSNTVTWVIIEGLTNVDVVERIGTMFDIHQLVLEDIMNTHQRPKFEEYDDYLYIVLKCLSTENDQFAVTYEQISLLVLKNFVFVFKEKKDDLFHPIQKRIRSKRDRLRKFGTDYLTYTILDIIVDQNFIVIDSLDDAINSVEDTLLASEPTKDTLNTIQRLKREVANIRKHVSPVRELIAGMLCSESELIDEKIHIYLKDVSDHAIRIIESIESYRDILIGLLDIYISIVGNKMNEIMKVLTIFASIFIPLTFLAGIYGMNFEYMPELKWKWAYPALWSVFITISVVLLIYFKRKKWL
ncbi:Magnesium and cobalt transport protein CorA [Dissulfuribacter thermophilus]|uniref:Magnesium transport protein CorA n=1 Tax=Dissulfuribacter thermophilus TaxID=1156395 RepID=A0A1B9F5X4_9BACT|nr:magnesium/cobalt transporter CorA [Dissulfuribacter thermophilus]OCC15326.1 Magnesium and cobalt transport protein CorA [Dissulfuribacter thermophilus]